MLENWSSRDVQRDPQGFLKAQQAERERKEAEANKQQEQDDLESASPGPSLLRAATPVTPRKSGGAPAASKPPRARGPRRKRRAF